MKKKYRMNFPFSATGCLFFGTLCILSETNSRARELSVFLAKDSFMGPYLLIMTKLGYSIE